MASLEQGTWSRSLFAVVVGSTKDWNTLRRSSEYNVRMLAERDSLMTMINASDRASASSNPVFRPIAPYGCLDVSISVGKSLESHLHCLDEPSRLQEHSGSAASLARDVDEFYKSQLAWCPHPAVLIQPWYLHRKLWWFLSPKALHLVECLQAE